jgi:predicted DNA-binding protein YlxM (UPF0122 family)
MLCLKPQEINNIEEHMVTKFMSKSLYQQLGISKDELKQLLAEDLEKDMSLPQLAEKYKVSTTAIHNYCKKFGLERRTKLRKDPSFLYQEYVTNQKSAAEIADTLGVSYQAVINYLDKFGIEKRSLSEVQQIAQQKRNNDWWHEQPAGRRGVSRGFMISIDGFNFRSLGEYIWYRENRQLYNQITYEPFVFESYSPDFLVDRKTVIEIKRSQSDLSNDEYETYIDKGKMITSRLGYKYQLIFIDEIYPDEYQKAASILREIGATPGYPFSLLTYI